MSHAERNRQIKSLLTKAFNCKVTVRGSRGTAYGWVSIDVDYAPRDRDELDQFKSKVYKLFAAANITIGTYGYNDPGSDYSFGSKMHLNFKQCRDVFNEGERVNYCGNTGTIKDRDHRAGGDWYVVALDSGVIESACYKNDMTRVTA